MREDEGDEGGNITEKLDYENETIIEDDAETRRKKEEPEGFDDSPGDLLEIYYLGGRGLTAAVPNGTVFFFFFLRPREAQRDDSGNTISVYSRFLVAFEFA